jgi:hypothetical protein
MKYRTLTTKSKENGADTTNTIEFDSEMMGNNMTKADVRALEWKMFNESGGDPNTKQRRWKINPYKFARSQFSSYVDPDQIISHSMGTDKLKATLVFLIHTHSQSPFVCYILNYTLIIEFCQ